MVKNGEVLKDKKILVQNGLQWLDAILYGHNITLKYDYYPPNISLREAFDQSRADFLMYHITDDVRLIEEILMLPTELLRRFIVLERRSGGITEKMRKDYERLENAGAMMVKYSTENLSERIAHEMIRVLSEED